MVDVLVRVLKSMSIGDELPVINLKYELYNVGPEPPLQPAVGAAFCPTLKLKFWMGLLKESWIAAVSWPAPHVGLITQRPGGLLVVTSIAVPRDAVLSFPFFGKL